jgi:hypothetical protein
MAEIVAALSLASNIVQFIDFGSNVLAAGYRLHKNRSGGSDNIPEIKYVTSAIQRLVKGFTECLPDDSAIGELSRTEVELRKLANQCSVLAEELLSAVSKIEVQGRLKKWNSFRAALKSVLAEEKIAKIQGRLDKFRQGLILHIIACFR